MSQSSNTWLRYHLVWKAQLPWVLPTPAVLTGRTSKVQCSSLNTFPQSSIKVHFLRKATCVFSDLRTEGKVTCKEELAGWKPLETYIRACFIATHYWIPWKLTRSIFHQPRPSQHLENHLATCHLLYNRQLLTPACLRQIWPHCPLVIWSLLITQAWPPELSLISLLSAGQRVLQQHNRCFKRTWSCSDQVFWLLEFQGPLIDSILQSTYFNLQLRYQEMEYFDLWFRRFIPKVLNLQRWEEVMSFSLPWACLYLQPCMLSTGKPWHKLFLKIENEKVVF